MPIYEYVAKDQSGNTFNEKTEAPDRQTVLEKLRGRNLIILSLKEKASHRGIPGLSLGRKAIRLDDIAEISRQLSTLVSSGIPILEGLDILVHQADNETLKQVLNRIKGDVETGSSLSAAFAKHPKVFSTLYVSMIKAGESSGMLDEILERLAMYLEKTSALQRKVKSALTYPIAVSCLALAITALMFLKVIPVFKDVFASFDADLPTPTLVVIAISDFARKYFVIVLVVIVLIVYALKRYINTEKGKTQYDNLLINLPMFGIIIRKIAISKFSRTLSTLIKSGVPILSSLEIVAKTSGNKVLEDAINSARISVREGESIATPLGRSVVFPPLVIKMISVGEKTGELEKMLSKISDFYDEQVDAAVSGLTSLIEPLIIAFLGVLIGSVVICIFMPIFKLSTIIHM